ncbi:hypothetical protein LAWI1_G001881 [Lachnellula willkommii]|uniref:Uncharacterized protein n=1 Tax=Lachnellula willkommii TaxID=215461 RepID=A0A559MLM7_9HELO|nr:hypothetical protein LAWI1_G001881 [Lachnellula willkommii]
MSYQHLQAGADGQGEQVRRSFVWPWAKVNKKYENEWGVSQLGDPPGLDYYNYIPGSHHNAQDGPCIELIDGRQSPKSTSYTNERLPVGTVQEANDVVTGLYEATSKHPPENQTLPRVILRESYNALPDLGLHSSISSPPQCLSTKPSSAELSSEIEESQTPIRMEVSETPLRGYGQDSGTHPGLQNQDTRAPHSSRTAWQQIQRLRIDNWSLRSQIHEIRARLREKQINKSVAEDLLFKCFRSQEVLASSRMPNLLVEGEKTIAELMEDCQNARDEYGPLEDDCTTLEDQLSGQELRLARIEEDFYNRPKVTSISNYDDSVNPAFRSVSPESKGSFDALDDIDTHPLASKFLSRLGDLDLLRERHGDLVEDREALEKERESRKQFQISLHADDQKWLDNATRSEEELLDEIHIVESDVAALRKQCLGMGLVDHNDELTNFESQEKLSFNGEEDVDSQDRISEYVKYPLLLPHPGVKHEVLAEYDPMPDERSDNTTNRINDWLLQQLRSSALEVRLLASTYEDKGGEINERWQFSVLSSWYKDGTIAASRKFRLYSSSSTTHVTRHSNVSELYHF